MKPHTSLREFVLERHKSGGRPTAFEIARAANESGLFPSPVTRSAVMGHLYRAKTKQPAKPAPLQGGSDLRPPKTCRWPLWGDGGRHAPDFGCFCGAPVAVAGASYCPAHMTRAYRKAADTEKKKAYP
ncbi:MAG: hypothetical protein QNJ84_11725 [Alphaproteobacteria bacterium]|nr:hypothetical protein [Alphaproteobacteria bacterium]